MKREVTSLDIKRRMLNYAIFKNGFNSNGRTYLTNFSVDSYLQMLRTHLYSDSWSHLSDEDLSVMICEILLKEAKTDQEHSKMDPYDILISLGNVIND